MTLNINRRLEVINETRPKLSLNILASKLPVVYGYTRVSTDVQHKQGKSLQAQEEMIRKYCVDKGLEEPKIVSDPAQSGSKMETRKNFTAMREAAKKGDTIISYSLSRIARSVKEITAFADEMQEKGVRIIILDKELDLSTAQGRLFFNVLATVDQFEREIDSERIRATMQSMKRQGTLVTKAPYGFKIEEGKLVENEEEMKMIDLIIMYIRDEPSIKVAEICRRLQAEVYNGNVKLRKTNTIHQKVISGIIKRHDIRAKATQE